MDLVEHGKCLENPLPSNGKDKETQGNFNLKLSDTMQFLRAIHLTEEFTINHKYHWISTTQKCDSAIGWLSRESWYNFLWLVGTSRTKSCRFTPWTTLHISCYLGLEQSTGYKTVVTCYVVLLSRPLWFSPLAITWSISYQYILRCTSSRLCFFFSCLSFLIIHGYISFPSAYTQKRKRNLHLQLHDLHV